jgi:hypothetical protein
MDINLINIQSKPIVVSSNTTAENDRVYHVVANATFTDPSPVVGKGYQVFVRNGTATINSVAYTEGTTVLRLFHSGSWTSYVSLPDSNFVPTTRTINGLDLSANRTLTASDVGAPSGSGSSTGTNTGDETQASILSKLGISKLKVTGDQSTTSTSAVDITDLVSGTLPSGKYAVNGSISIGANNINGVRIGITIPSGATMAVHAVGRGSNSVNNVRETLTSSGSLSSVFFGQVIGETAIDIFGTITIGETSGVLQFIFAKTTSGTATIYDEGTQIKIEKW